MASLVLDRIIELFSADVTISGNGQREVSYISQGTVHAAFNPRWGDEKEENRLFGAQQDDLFIIRQMSGVNTQWIVEYDGKRYDIKSVLEGIGNSDTRPRGRYMSIRGRWRENQVL